MKARLISINVPASDVNKAKDFYQHLLGVEFARNLTDASTSYHLPLSSHGTILTISPRQNPKEPIVCHFAVDDLDAAVAAITQMGGKVVVNKFTLPIAGGKPRALYEAAVAKRGHVATTHSMGTAVIIADLDGNHVALVHLEAHAQLFFDRDPVGAARLIEHQAAIAHGKQL